MSFEPATKQPDSIIRIVQKMGFTVTTEFAKKISGEKNNCAVMQSEPRIFTSFKWSINEKHFDENSLEYGHLIMDQNQSANSSKLDCYYFDG